jgi:hypothetical protein
MRITYKMLVGTLERKSQLGRLSSNWKDYIEMYLTGICLMEDKEI